MRADVAVLYDSFASDMVLRYVTDVFSNPVEEHTLSSYHHAVLLAYRVFSFRSFFSFGACFVLG